MRPSASMISRLVDDMRRLSLSSALPTMYNYAAMLQEPLPPYHLPIWNHLLNSQQTDSNVPHVSKAGYKVSLDVTGYRPHELSVKAVNDSEVIIEGKMEQLQEEYGSFLSRHFVRKYVLPVGFDVSKAMSTLSSDGVLTINIPHEFENAVKERVIPIQQTGPSQLTPIEQPAVEAESTSPIVEENHQDPQQQEHTNTLYKKDPNQSVAPKKPVKLSNAMKAKQKLNRPKAKDQPQPTKQSPAPNLPQDYQELLEPEEFHTQSDTQEQIKPLVIEKHQQDYQMEEHRYEPESPHEKYAPIVSKKAASPSVAKEAPPKMKQRTTVRDSKKHDSHPEHPQHVDEIIHTPAQPADPKHLESDPIPKELRRDQDFDPVHEPSYDPENDFRIFRKKEY